MNWSDPVEFFAMGGYGMYVWGSIGAAIIAVQVECLALRQRRKAALLQLVRMQDTGIEEA
ncbi:MAG TPA: heme exporter protein CcmD [Burkholderiaceae bacterium]|nr:heme exporter protein CcmD [Burkholderiaceae bacterium]